MATSMRDALTLAGVSAQQFRSLPEPDTRVPYKRVKPSGRRMGDGVAHAANKSQAKRMVPSAKMCDEYKRYQYGLRVNNWLTADMKCTPKE